MVDLVLDLRRYVLGNELLYLLLEGFMLS